MNFQLQQNFWQLDDFPYQFDCPFRNIPECQLRSISDEQIQLQSSNELLNCIQRSSIKQISETEIHQIVPELVPVPVPVSAPIPKTHKYKSYSAENQNGDNSVDEFDPEAELGRKKRSKRALRKGYPTKNFLVNFKKSHIYFLAKILGRQILDDPLIEEILKKDGINMKDYEKIYKTEKYKPALEKYFSSKLAYRDLMQSRVNADLKKVYMARIPVFEQSYRNGKFDHIN